MTYPQYPNGKCYLAGPIAGLTYNGATDWREFLSHELAKHGIAGMSPMRGKEALSSIEGELEPMDSRYDSLLSSQRAIFDRDYHDCTTCDVLFVNLQGSTRVSIGTMFELAWAKQKQIPVVLLMDEGDPFHNHPFVLEVASFRPKNMNETFLVILSILLPDWEGRKL